MNCFKQNVAQFRASTDGAIGMLYAITAAPVLFFIGASVDVGRVLHARETMQAAVDGAMLASAKATGAQRATIAAAYFNANLRGVRNASASFVTGDDGNLNGTAKAVVKTPFVAVLGKTEIAVSVSAKVRPQTTMLIASERIPCLHVMDQSGSRTFSLDSNTSLNASNCDARVRSGASDGVYERTSQAVKFGMVRVKGASSITSGYTAAGFSIVNDPFRVKDGEAIVSDPYSRFVDDVRSQITVAKCNGSNTNRTLTGNVSPGTYCGATEFKNAKLAAGLYIISSSGSLAGTLKFSGLIDGSAGVSFYLPDSKATFLSYNADQGSVLAAPKSGLTQGLLFFDSSNRGGVYSVTISSCKMHSWTGLIYMPGTNFAFQNLDSWPKFNISISANQVSFKGTYNVTLDAFAWTPNGQSAPVMWPGEPITKTLQPVVLN